MRPKFRSVPIYMPYEINPLIDALLFENVFSVIYTLSSTYLKNRNKIFCVTKQSVTLDIATMVDDALLAMMMYLWVDR